jgi:protein-tyrosine phosphatase
MGRNTTPGAPRTPAMHYQWHRAPGVSAACAYPRQPRPEQVTPVKGRVTCGRCLSTVRYREPRDSARDLRDPQVQRESGHTAHGFIPFDVPVISPIVPGLWQGGCQDGLVLPRFIDHLVSLYPWGRYDVEHDLASTRTIRMLDAADQDMTEVDDVARKVNVLRETGTVLVHCQAGLNRSGLVVARALMLDGMSADAAIALVRERRSPAALCNPMFEKWLRGLDVAA